MKKRFLSILLALCMVLTLLPSAAFAADSDFTIENGVLTKYNGSGGDVAIPNGVTSIGVAAFQECTSLTSVNIPVGVTNIGDRAFDGCVNLINVAIPDGVTTIGELAFSLCSMTSVTIPSGVTSIGDKAFNFCDSLTSIIIPSTVTSIGRYAFLNCHSLTSVTISSGVTSIGPYAFYGCGLTSVTIPSSIASIGDWAFSYCDRLTSVTISSGVTRIEDSAFSFCRRLTNVTIPSSITSIGDGAFVNCAKLTDVYYGGTQAQWETVKIIGKRNYCLVDATIHYNSTGLGENPEYKVYCGLGYPNSYEAFDVSLEECIAKTVSTTTYNPQLAHMLIAMSNSVYDMTDMEKTYGSFGFETPKLEVNPYISYAVSKKKLADSSTLVLVVVRGTKLTSLLEWGNNVAGYLPPNDAGQQSGFAGVASWIYRDIETILQRSMADCSNVKFVITGFSRGAATANILAAELVDEGIPQNDIYAYTFACPDTVIITEDAANKYQCIFNIGDVCDFVSWSPSGSLAGKFSDWSKYGRSYWYSDIWDNFENLEMGMDAHDQARYLGYLRSEKSTTEYRTRWAAKSALDDASQRRLWNSIQNIGKTVTSFVGVHCPVDVEIYASGRLVGSITSNLAVVYDESKVYISVINDEKNIYLLADDTYTFNLTATGEGVMEYTVQNINTATRKVVDEQVFENVTLTPNKELTSVVTVEENVAVDVKANKIKLYVMDTNGEPEKEVLPDGSGTEVPVAQSPVIPVAFTDVPANAYYYNAVLWAVENGVTTGKTTTTFAPNDPCTRAQIVTFLWRAMGSPVVASSTAFTDVAPSSYYEKAVAWAVANGITTGKTADGFAPNDPCTRAQAVTFLHRAKKSPAVSGSSFSDVASGAYYEGAVAWAVANGITEGTGNGRFSPNSTCTRGQIVTFLYRDMV